MNGLYTIYVEIRGEGTPLKIELAKPSQYNFNLGAIGPHHSTTRVVSLVNRSRVATRLSLNRSSSLLQAYGIEILPRAELFLRPKESGDITFFFRPPGRLLSFSESFGVDVVGIHIPMLVVSGACLGTEIKLASTSLPFYPVTKGSRASKRLQLENTGDVGARFVWDPRDFGQNFSIIPHDGFLPPGRDVKLEVVFHPKIVSQDIRVEKIRCQVDGMKRDSSQPVGLCFFVHVDTCTRKQRRKLYSYSLSFGVSSSLWLWAGWSSLMPQDSWISYSKCSTIPGQHLCLYSGGEDQFLTLTGACVESRPQSEAVLFECRVRNSVKQSITVQNPSTSPWQLRPTIQNDFWSGPEFLSVPQGGQADYVLTYSPYTMTLETKPHEGSVFFPIPDGTGLLFNLHGISMPPDAQEVLEVQIGAKQLHVESIRIANWLPYPQRFQVTFNREQCDETTRIQASKLLFVFSAFSSKHLFLLLRWCIFLLCSGSAIHGCTSSRKQDIQAVYFLIHTEHHKNHCHIQKRVVWRVFVLQVSVCSRSSISSGNSEPPVPSAEKS